jgi:zinc protease
MTRTIRILALLALTLGACMTNGCSSKKDKVVGYEVPDDPTVSFRIWFKTGTQLDPPGKEGLAVLTATLMTEGGTQANSYEQILEKLNPLAAGYGSNVDKEMTIISGRTHKDNIDTYYSLFTDAILHPGFRDEDFTRIKSDMINGIEKQLRYSSDEELGKAALYDFVFAGTPYGHLNDGTVEALKSITIDDVKAFYKANYTRDNVVVGIGGGYDKALVDRLEKDLAALPEGKVQLPAKPAPKPIDGLEVTMVEKDCDATAISVGFPIDVLRGDDDFFALALFNSWFGEHRNSSSHLYQVIREKRGMNYGDYSYIEVFPNGGRLQMPQPNTPRRQQLFEVWVRPVQHAHRHFALRAAMRELKAVVDKGMTQEEFDLTKKFLIKYALHFASTTSERLGYELDSRFYGLGGDYIEIYRRKMEAMTLEQVNAAIKKHLQYKNVKIAIVTKDAAQFKADLVSNAPSPVTYTSPKPDEVLNEDKEIQVFPLDIKAEKVRIVPVEEMFQK